MLGWALNLGFAGSGTVSTAPEFTGSALRYFRVLLLAVGAGLAAGHWT